MLTGTRWYLMEDPWVSIWREDTSHEGIPFWNSIPRDALPRTASWKWQTPVASGLVVELPGVMTVVLLNPMAVCGWTHIIWFEIWRRVTAPHGIAAESQVLLHNPGYSTVTGTMSRPLCAAALIPTCMASFKTANADHGLLYHWSNISCNCRCCWS